MTTKFAMRKSLLRPVGHGNSHVYICLSLAAINYFYAPRIELEMEIATRVYATCFCRLSAALQIISFVNVTNSLLSRAFRNLRDTQTGGIAGTARACARE
jgi:hypothetical protein